MSESSGSILSVSGKIWWFPTTVKLLKSVIQCELVLLKFGLNIFLAISEKVVVAEVDYV